MPPDTTTLASRGRYTSLYLLNTLSTDQRSEPRYSPRLARDHVALASYCLIVRRFASAQAHAARARGIVLAGLGSDTVLYMAVLNVLVSQATRC